MSKDPKADSELEPSVAEHGVWGTDSEAVGGFGESYSGQVAHGGPSEPAMTPEDSALTDALRKSLGHAHVDAADLRVVVEQGHATLYGSVRHSYEQSELETRARSVPGIREVTSHLTVLNEDPKAR
jgi:osmotically-inducible protein OsmY